jgi:hypothetical protein
MGMVPQEMSLNPTPQEKHPLLSSVDLLCPTSAPHLHKSGRGNPGTQSFHSIEFLLFFLLPPNSQGRKGLISLPLRLLSPQKTWKETLRFAVLFAVPSYVEEGR